MTLRIRSHFEQLISSVESLGRCLVVNWREFARPKLRRPSRRDGRPGGRRRAARGQGRAFSRRPPSVRSSRSDQASRCEHDDRERHQWHQWKRRRRMVDDQCRRGGPGDRGDDDRDATDSSVDHSRSASPSSRAVRVPVRYAVDNGPRRRTALVWAPMATATMGSSTACTSRPGWPPVAFSHPTVNTRSRTPTKASATVTPGGQSRCSSSLLCRRPEEAASTPRT